MDCGEYEKRTHILTTFDKGLQLFYQGDMTRARQVFEKIAGEDPAAAAYVQKCDELSDISLEEWRGVWVMTTK